MRHMIVASFALALSGCAAGMGAVEVAPRPGESPCAYGRRMIDRAQERLNQARSAAETVCPYVEQLR